MLQKGVTSIKTSLICYRIWYFVAFVLQVSDYRHIVNVLDKRFSDCVFFFIFIASLTHSSMSCGCFWLNNCLNIVRRYTLHDIFAVLLRRKITDIKQIVSLHIIQQRNLHYFEIPLQLCGIWRQKQVSAFLLSCAPKLWNLVGARVQNMIWKYEFQFQRA